MRQVHGLTHQRPAGMITNKKTKQSFCFILAMMAQNLTIQAPQSKS